MTGSSANFEPPTVALVQIWRYGASTGGSKSQSPKKISLENSSKSRAEPLGNSLKLGEGEEILNEIENEFAQRLSLTSSNGEASCGPPQSVGDESSQTRNERRDCPYAPRQEIPQEEVKKIETLGRRNLAFQVGNAALCSEMGVHISPCGKFLILCVAYKVRPLSTKPLISTSWIGLLLKQIIVYMIKLILLNSTSLHDSSTNRFLFGDVILFRIHSLNYCSVAFCKSPSLNTEYYI